MSKPLFITFDPYYNVSEYNNLLTAAKNNGLDIDEYISIRQPFNRYLKINDKTEAPIFLNYDYASPGQVKFLVSVVKPVEPNEALYLKRKSGQDALYYKYITPKPLRNLEEKDYVMVFKAKSFSEVANYSKKLGKSKIYKWGKSIIKGYNIYYVFNPYIKGIIPESKVLMEFGKQASTGIKYSKSMPKIKGDLEYYLNTFVLIKEKITNKTLEAVYWSKGEINPLKKTRFI